jgi:hypothetical protein
MRLVYFCCSCEVTAHFSAGPGTCILSTHLLLLPQATQLLDGWCQLHLLLLDGSCDLLHGGAHFLCRPAASNATSLLDHQEGS